MLVYRAFDKNNKLVFGQYVEIDNIPYIFENGKTIEIQKNTLAIHHPRLIAGQSYNNDKRIFASLGENGIGGDILDYGYYGYRMVAIFNDNGFIPMFLNSNTLKYPFKSYSNEYGYNNFKIIEIKTI